MASVMSACALAALLATAAAVPEALAVTEQGAMRGLVRTTATGVAVAEYLGKSTSNLAASLSLSLSFLTDIACDYRCAVRPAAHRRGPLRSSAPADGIR